VKPNRKTIAVVIIVATALALVAGLMLNSRSSLPDQSRDAVQSSSGSSDRAELPEFSARLIDGKTFTSDDIEAPAVIHLYASWCQVCKSEAPAFAELQRTYGDKLNFYFVAVEDTPTKARGFMREHGWQDAPLIDDPRRELEAEFSLVGQPHTIYVDRDRKLSVHQGGGSFGDLEALARSIS